MTYKPAYWALVAAAGLGRRMGATTPKQYLPLAGRTVIEHSLDCLARHPAITGLVIVISRSDKHWASLDYQSPKPLITAEGGEERCDSVLAGLQALDELADDNDWVFVHDAARACLTAGQLDKLIAEVGDDPVGGLLALRSRDTLKRAVDGRAQNTIDRESIWQAQTPQMFRLGLLRTALSNALATGLPITDEAMAMEKAGHRPLLVEGEATNIKLTTAEDLLLAEFILDQQKATQ